MKQPTDEQKLKAQERRTKTKAICDEIAAMSETARAALASKCLAVTVEGHVLSPFNQCLIAYQFESATIVGGFRQWIKAGRSVKKGEHCISIWVPKMPKQTDSTISATASADKEHTAFLMGAIFDVSQTEPLTEKETAK